MMKTLFFKSLCIIILPSLICSIIDTDCAWALRPKATRNQTPTKKLSPDWFLAVSKFIPSSTARKYSPARTALVDRFAGPAGTLVQPLPSLTEPAVGYSLEELEVARNELLNMSEVIERSNYLIQRLPLLLSMKDELKRRLKLSAEERVQRLSLPAKIFSWVMQGVVFTILLKITDRRIIRWLGMSYLENISDKKGDSDGEFVSGLSMIGPYLDFAGGLEGLRLLEKIALYSPHSIAARNRFITELERTLYYVKKALDETDGKVRVKVHAAGMGLNALMALMILRDTYQNQMDRLEFTIADYRLENIQKIKEITELCGLDRNVFVIVEDITRPATGEGARYHVQTAIGILEYFTDDEDVVKILNNIQRLSAPDGIVITSGEIDHFNRSIIRADPHADTKPRTPKDMVNLAEEAALTQVFEGDYQGTALYDIFPVLVFTNRAFASRETRLPASKSTTTDPRRIIPDIETPTAIKGDFVVGEQIRRLIEGSA